MRWLSPSRKFNPDITDRGAWQPLCPTYFLVWSDEDGQPITYRLDFTDGSHATTWYGFDDPTYASGVSWFVGSMTDDTPTGPQTYTYTTLNTACGSWTTLDDITFPYDREVAAAYAIEHSYANINGPATNDSVSRRLNPNPYNIPFAHFHYTNVNFNGEEGGTGSAVFVSEAIWMGGMPMTIGFAASCEVGDPYQIVAPGAGWRFCWVPTAAAGNSGKSWNLHKALVTYYTTDTTIIPREPAMLNSILPNKGEQLIFPTLPNLKFISESDLAPYINVSEGGGGGINTSGLASFAEDHLGQLLKGDYMWIDSVSKDSTCVQNCGDAHGFLIVGWGPPATCDNAFATVFAPSDFFNAESDTSDPVVPYVADFIHYFYQLPIPRPFYCSAYFQDDFENFFKHNWYFYTLLDPLPVPADEIYVDQLWQWEDTDG